MKRILTLLAALTLASSALSAQDIITKRNGEDIRANVLEIGVSEIRYQLYDNPNGPVYVIDRASVLMIRYENGNTESFAAPAPAATQGIGPLFPANPRYSDEPLRPGMTYAELRQMYNPRDYMKGFGSQYSPGWSGFGSLVIPGLGQICCGEAGRGLGFFVPAIALTTTNLVLSSKLADLIQTDAEGRIILTESGVVYTDPQKARTLSGIQSVVSVVSLALSIWSCVDAVRVAKVKNMYYQDLRNGYSMDFRLSPSLDLAQTPSGFRPAPGMALSLRF